MHVLRDRLRDIRSTEGGFSLIEVVVAMFIFAVISTGAAYAMLSVIQTTRDSRSRHVATNLAAQEIDLARDVNDLFALLDAERTVTLNGDTFHVTRATQWVSSPSVTAGCGGTTTAAAPTAGGTTGILRYKRVNVTVSWDGMGGGVPPARADTVIDPTSRINAPGFGTILVSVKSVSGAGMPGIAVSATPATPANGAIAPPSQAMTDAQGCTYVLKVRPGNYDVKISKPGYVDVDQFEQPVKMTAVAAGTSSSVGFQYDRASDVTVNHASGAAAPTVYLPNNLRTSYLSSAGVFTETLGGSGVNDLRSRTSLLYPFSAGYQAIAGRYVAPSAAAPIPGGCVSVDPMAWPPTTVAGSALVGTRPTPAASLPGGVATADVRMGIATVVQTALTGAKFLQAVPAVAPATGDPGCADALSYTFGPVLSATPSTIALPWGSWTLFYGDAASSMVTPLAAASITVNSRGVLTGDVVTFDPREPTP